LPALYGVALSHREATWLFAAFALAQAIAAAMEAEEAASVIVVIERFADSAISVNDTAWARAIDDAFREIGVAVRCFLISHRRGVRWLAADDYRFPSPR